MSDLFSSPVLRIEQPRRVPSAKSQYKVFDAGGVLVAKAEERAVSLRRQAWRAVMLDGDDRRTVQVEDARGTPVLVIERPKRTRASWISTPDGALHGSIRQDGYQWRYQLLNAAEHSVGRLEGNKTARKFKVLDTAGTHVAQVDKKWKGAATELLTTADRYAVTFFHTPPDPLRILVIAAPIALDLILYEGKDIPNFLDGLTP
ncbi:phospholipid scramblase-related protein [Actinomadura sp. KC216]|uniref:phospholipid scramblase-related protein n=1 Tax=Actinomadura sp. KC216 TaxID=2530370 RepID=UPI00140454D6|nr:phospholipid scramblase-related protein [Actinomadura sp. KC216]